MEKKLRQNVFIFKARKNILLTCVLFLFSFCTLQAQQNKDFFFQKLTTFNGLSSNSIRCVFRDSRGYVWIGTSNGLNRYDGKNIKVYHHKANNPSSLPREDVRQIAEDKNGNLWIGADYGLIEFNPITEQFNFYRHEAGNPKSLIDDHIPTPFIDSKNNLWISTEKGLQLYDLERHSFITVKVLFNTISKKNQFPVNIWRLLEDKNNIIWGTGERGIYRFNPSKNELEIYPAPNNKADGYIVDIFLDHESNFWATQWERKLSLFHTENGLYESIPVKTLNRSIAFGEICEWKDPSGQYWLVNGTSGGLFFYNKKTRESIMVQADPSNPYSLIDNEISYLYTDKENMLWIGTNKGLNILDNANQYFNYNHSVERISNIDKTINLNVESIYDNKELKMISYVWEGGLGIYDNKWNLVKFYRQIPPSDSSHEARNIFDFYKDFRGFYWITTDNGLVRFDLQKNRFQVFLAPKTFTGHIQEPMMLREIIPFDSTSFYLRSKIRGIYKFDFVKEQFVQHLIHNDKYPTSLPTNYLRAVLKDGNNRLIIISVNAGIFIFDLLRNTYEIFNHNSDPSINEALNNLYFDPCLSGDILWLNSAHGLLKFNLQTKKFELFNSRNGLANDFLRSNEMDNKGNLWVAHNAGISRFDTASHTFTNYSESNGLAVQEFYSNMRKMADGNIYISNRDRLLYFDPEHFKSNRNVPQVHINSILVLNAPFNYTPDSATQKKSLTLTYDQDLITVDFSVLNFSHPNENQFYFRLDKDTVWRNLNEGSVNLARLSPGSYILHVTGSNNSGVMNPVGDSLYINILPPYYQTWWFRILILLILVIFILTIRWRGIKRIKYTENLKTEFNKQLAQAETKALRSQMNPHFIFNSLNSINSFVLDKKHELASDYLIKFSKLIRLILDNSRSETITIEKELETLKLYVSLESARFDNKFTCVYQVAEDVNLNSVMIPPMLLQPFVENAIWHGLMQKEGEGTITIGIKKLDEEFLNISVEDDGIGRAKAAELKSKSATHNSHGLKVTTERIEMMNKLNSTSAQVHVIDLHNEQGQATGTRVELIIPY